MQPTKPVTMAREFLPQLATPLERNRARASVAESMARLFPSHTYDYEEVVENGKLLVVTYTYKFSRFKAFRNLLKAILVKHLSRLNHDPRST